MQACVGGILQRLILGDGKVSKIIRNKNDKILTHQDFDITDQKQVMDVITKSNADVVINAVAKTNLEWCQENKIECYNVNTHGILNVLNACATTEKKLVHISSGCLFDGNQEISTETSCATPAVWYTWTKLWADQIIENYGYDNFLILRPRQLISAVAHPTNLLTKFASMKKIDAIDEDNSVTCIEDFSQMIDHLLKVDAKGVYNCANSGIASPYWIANEIQHSIAPHLEVRKVDYDNFLKTLKNKRVNTILSTNKIESTGYVNRSAKDAVRWCLQNYHS